MKKVKIIAIIMVYIGLILINTHVFAASKGKTINDTTRIREKASTSSSTVTLVSINQEVEIISKDGDWYKVKYKNNGKTYSGYIRSDMLDIEQKEEIKQEENKTEKEEEKTTESIENSTESDKTVDNTQGIEIKEGITAVLKSKTEIRILPLINSNITGNIAKKTEIRILEKLGAWTYIESEEKAGWVITSKLQENLTSETKNDKTEIKTEKETNKKEESKPVETTKKEDSTETKKEEQKMYISSQTVNLRKESNSNSTILKQLSRNKQVTVIEKVNNTWSKVEVDGITGYISSTYLSEKKTEVTSRGSEKSREEKKEENNKEETKEEESKKEETKKTENKTSETNKKEENKTSETVKKEESKTEEIKTSSKVTGNDIVKYARKYLGYKYVLGAASPKNGFDCSGLTSYVYSKNGYTLNRTSSAQASNGKKVSKSNLKVGDLVFFSQGSKKIGHVGIYIGGNEFIHAANPKKGVVITSLSNSYYSKNYVTARRIID